MSLKNYISTYFILFFIFIISGYKSYKLHVVLTITNADYITMFFRNKFNVISIYD